MCRVVWTTYANAALSSSSFPSSADRDVLVPQVGEACSHSHENLRSPLPVFDEEAMSASSFDEEAMSRPRPIATLWSTGPRFGSQVGEACSHSHGDVRRPVLLPF